MPQIEVLAHVLQDFRLDSHLRLLECCHLLEQSPRKLLLHVWQASKHAREANEIQEHLIERLREVLLVCAVQDVPELPEHFAEDFLSYVLVLNIVLRVDANYLGQRLHQVLERRLLPNVLMVFVMERLQCRDDILTIL